MTLYSEAPAFSKKFSQILKSVQALTPKEQLTLAKLLLENILNAHLEAQDEWPAGFFEATAGRWAGDPLVREPQGDYETRAEL
ncbi:MAG: hypothetical protein ACLFTI_03935 [Anaerolineales bacterium]